MPKIHEAILQIIVDQSAERCLEVEIASLPTDMALKRMFYNLKGKKGLRLTPEGNEIMSNFFEHHILKMPDDFQILPKHLIYLNKYMRFPYFFKPSVKGESSTNEIKHPPYLTLYHNADAVFIKLADADLNKLVKMDKSSLEWKI